MSAHQMLAKAHHVAVVPNAALELSQLLENSKDSKVAVIAVLRQDTVLMAKDLKACNSPLSGLRRPVASLNEPVPPVAVPKFVGSQPLALFVCIWPCSPLPSRRTPTISGPIPSPRLPPPKPLPPLPN